MRCPNGCKRFIFSLRIKRVKDRHGKTKGHKLYTKCCKKPVDPALFQKQVIHLNNLICKKGVVKLVKRTIDEKTRYVIISPSKITKDHYSERQQLRDDLNDAKEIFEVEANKWKGFKYPEEKENNLFRWKE